MADFDSRRQNPEELMVAIYLIAAYAVNTWTTG
jgi:hypothetical protein